MLILGILGLLLPLHPTQVSSPSPRLDVFVACFPHLPGHLGWEAQPAVVGGPAAAAGLAGALCPQVQDVVKCQMGVCRADESEDSPDSCKNGQLQILVS